MTTPQYDLIIKGLQQENASLREEVEKEREWLTIQPGGEYPEYMQTVIIHTEIGFVAQAQFGGSRSHPVFSIGDEWYIATHWMPLPLPPKP